MGIIIKQSIKGSIWSYLGVLIGFVTVGYLFQKYLETDVIGLFGLFVSYSVLFAQFSSLGINGVTSRLFPYFRDKANKHNGFFFLTIITIIVGFSLFLIVFFIIKPFLIESNLEKSKLFADYILLLIPLTFFTLLFVVLDIINKLLYDAVLGTFLQDFIQRILILAATLLYVVKVLDLNWFIIAYASIVCVKGLIMLIYLIAKKEFDLQPKPQFLTHKLKKEMMDVAIFSILAGLGSNIIFYVDKIIINQMMGLGQTGVYTMAFFFGSLVAIPSRTLLKISGTLIADAWKRNDLEHINYIYKKSCINQFIIGSFLVGGILINIDNILEILGPNYHNAKWVIIFIALGDLIDMATGANGYIIGYSKHYRMSLWFILILVILVIVTMLLFIPVWGITGAALAIALSFFMNNLMRFFFLYKKYNMQPFNGRFLWVVAIFTISYLAVIYLPQLSLIWDILVRSSIFTLFFFFLIIILKISTDINTTLHKIISKFM